MDQYFNPLI